MVDKTLLEVKRLSNKKIGTGGNLKDILAYSGVSLWWFIEHSIYLRLKGSRDRERTDNKFIIAFICQLMKTFIILKSSFRGILGKLVQINSTSSNQKKIFVCGSLEHWREIQHSTTLKKRKGDAILGNIIDSLERNGFNVFGIDRDDSHSIDVKRFFDKLSHGRGVWRPLETYLTFDAIKTSFRETRRLEKKWEEFLGYISSEDEKGKELANQLSKDFKPFFIYHIFQAVLYMGLAKTAIEAERPKLIFVAVEHSDCGRAIVAIGKMKGIPTVTVQHGFHSHANLMFFNIPKETVDKISPQYHPLPDKICVYGPWIKKILTKEFNYPKKKVVVTGPPRYDILTKTENIFDRKKFCKKFGIDTTKPIVLINTQPLSPFEKREILLRELLKELKKIKNIEIVIKPHPVENESWHKRIAKEESVRTIILPKTSNICEALYSCDVMITSSSTTSLEAMILDKAVIIANLVEDPWAIPLMKSKGAIGIKNKKDITKTVNKALYDKKTKAKLKRGRKKFVYQHVYKQDGKATERVINVIRKMINS